MWGLLAGKTACPTSHGGTAVQACFRGVLVIISLCVADAWAQRPSKTVLDGAYTAAQAQRGAAVYQSNCAKCHEGSDVDGPPLTGDPFIDRWREDSLSSLFDFIKGNMPQDKPGNLDEAMYRDVLAYLLEANMYRVGNQELSAESIGNTLLVGPGGPQPLPTNTLVRVVGCLASGANGVWMLAPAANPTRTRVTDRSSPEELRSSAARTLGNQTFRLQNLDDLTPFHGDALKGHKVQVKGVLIRQANNDRINVASVESVGNSCGP
jgi:quinoprotein glucose dehydrogenase